MRLILTIIATLVFAGCAYNKINLVGVNNSQTSNEVLSLGAKWVKDKGDKFDIEVVLTNLSDQALEIPINDLRCYKGQSRGLLKHEFLRAYRTTIDLAPHQTLVFVAICELGAEGIPGNFRMEVERALKSGNDEVVVQNLTWGVTPAGRPVEGEK